MHDLLRLKLSSSVPFFIIHSHSEEYPGYALSSGDLNIFPRLKFAFLISEEFKSIVVYDVRKRVFLTL